MLTKREIERVARRNNLRTVREIEKYLDRKGASFDIVDCMDVVNNFIAEEQLGKQLNPLKE